MIKIYQVDGLTQQFEEISTNSFNRPVNMTIPPGGKHKTIKLFLRNDDESKYYTDLVLRPVNFTGGAIDGDSITVKLLSGDREPTEVRWSEVGANGPPDGGSILPGECAILQSPTGGGARDTRIPELGTSAGADTKYYPFWVRAEASRGAPLGDYSLGFSIECTEGLVV